MEASARHGSYKVTPGFAQGEAPFSTNASEAPPQQEQEQERERERLAPSDPLKKFPDFSLRFYIVPGVNDIKDTKDYSQLSRAELIQLLQEKDASPAPSTAESALRDSETRIRAILDTAVEGIITIDDSGIIESANPAAVRIFGYDASELIGQNIKILMPSPDRELHDSRLARYRETGQAKIIGIGREVLGQRKDKTIFPMDLAVSEVKLAHKRLFTGFVRDITERKQNEAKLADLARHLEEKNKELETIVYVASHDLRSPLVNIQGFSKELQRACARIQTILKDHPEATAGELAVILGQDIPEAMDFIQAGVSKIDALLSGFLRFSRLGRAAIRLETLNMNSILGHIALAMDFQIKQAGATLEIGQLPPAVGDPTQINQVFTNLLDNAVKYLHPARPGLIQITGAIDQGTSIYRVRDNGIGIAPEHHAKVFEIFHRLNPSAGDGDGLGLTIAQKILERQNGRITLELGTEPGCSFLVFLPHPERKVAPNPRLH